MNEKQGSRGAGERGSRGAEEQPFDIPDERSVVRNRSGGAGEPFDYAQDRRGSKGARKQENHPPIAPRLPSTVYRLPALLLWLLILTFALFFSALSLQQHAAFQTNGLDLGNVDQALWNTAHGRFLRFSLMTPVESRLALHVEPILLAFVPFYWLGLGGPALLLISQASVVALGAWPLYQLTVIRFQSSIAATNIYALRTTHYLSLAFPLAYLLLPTLQSAVLFDFHAVTLAPTFFLFAWLALEQRRDRAFIIFLLLAMACKEDMPLVAVMVGLTAGLAYRRWRLAGLTIGLSALWFGLAFFVIQPNFAAGGNIQLDRYGWLGDSPPAMLRTLLTQPGLVFDHLWRQVDLPDYLTWLLFPTAFLALFSPVTLLPMLPTLAINLLSDNPFTWRLEDFHYGAPLAPFLFISAVYGSAWLVGTLRMEGWRVGRLEGWRIGDDERRKYPAGSAFQRMKTGVQSALWTPVFSPLLPRSLAPLLLCLLLLTFSLIYHTQRGYTPLARPFQWPPVTAHERELAAYLKRVPPETALFAQSNLAPHLSQRPTIYTDFAYFTDPTFPVPAPVEDILLDVTAFENLGGLHQFLRQTLLDSGSYDLITAQDGFLHFRPTNLATPSSFVLPEPFYTFAQPATPAQFDLTVDFGDQVRLRGYTLHFNRQEEIQVSLDLEALQPLANLRPVLYLLDDRGEPKGATTDLQPGLVWFPVEQWPVGKTIRLRFNTFPWHTRDTERYRLALGFIHGDDPWAIEQRLAPRLGETGLYALRLPAEGSLVELARIEQRWGMPGGGPPRRQFTAPNLSHNLNAIFSNQIELLGYHEPAINDPTSPPLPRSSAPLLSITLAWRSLAPLPPLTRFVQLVGPDGQVYGQQDSAPDNGHYPTHLWQPDEIVVETVTFALPPERPDGRYILHLGLYYPDTGQRLPLTSGGDHVEIKVP